MRKIRNWLNGLFVEEQATSAVEYAVMLSLIVVVCIVALVGLAEAAYDALWDAVEALE